MLTLSAFKYQKGLQKEIKGDCFKIALYNIVQTDSGCTMFPNTFIHDAFNIEKSQKSNKRSMAWTIVGRPKGKAKERPKDAQPAGTEKGRGLIPLVVGFRV
jgi:hypothetical protein